MCTAIIDGRLFGRTLDLEGSYGENIVITPRRFDHRFLYATAPQNCFAIIGTAHVSRGVPLYYDAANEMGLCTAALRFPEVTVYRPPINDRLNLASFEVIPWLLCNFESAKEARAAIENLNITCDNISPSLPSTPLHWIVADKDSAFVIESVADGVKIYDNEIGIMTNAPDFPEQISNLKKSDTEKLLGDGSSTSRFIRASYAKAHTVQETDRTLAISRFFHIMSTVSLPHGYSRGLGNKPMKTLYTSCIDTKDLIYYFTTYACRQIHGIRLYDFDLSSDTLITRPMPDGEEILYMD